MNYPGLTYIGSGKITGLYGLNETIHDQKSIGLQHLYIDGYENDFIYCAMSVVRLNDHCYYGDRIKAKSGHPRKIKSDKSYCVSGFKFVDEYIYEQFNKVDTVYCADDYTLSFNCRVENTSTEPIEVEVSSYIITTDNPYEISKEQDTIQLNSMDKIIRMQTEEENLVCRVSNESPSGFMYHGIQNLLYSDNVFEDGYFRSRLPVAVTVSKTITLLPMEKYDYNWCLNMSDQKVDFIKLEANAEDYWRFWLSKTAYPIEEAVIPNLIALKSVTMNGFIPADLTGHYFANNDVSFYVRDAIHGARAFLYSGFYDECKAIILLVTRLERKANNELYQRYNSKLDHDEGANNNVFSQIDVIGYLLRVVADYYHITGELLISVENLLEEVRILDSIGKKNGLYGPEGGVNEGVYGPAFITSTNMFIVGGLIGLREILKKENRQEYDDFLESNICQMISAINQTYLEENYFAYGYVKWDDQLVIRYDTPQLLGASLGYPMDDYYRQNFKTLTDIATYFNYGYGYSEQQYHDGPWIFNTAFAAQNAFLMEDNTLYGEIMTWIDQHKNAYGLLPEAVDARNEYNSFINPLMWANAEYICAKYAYNIKKIRTGDFI